MQRRWLETIRSAGDADLGAALVRLAQQAAAVHRREAARAEPPEAGPAAEPKPGPAEQAEDPSCRADAAGPREVRR